MPNDAESRRESRAVSERPAGSPTAGRSWQRTGGGAALAASILLVIATWVEYLVLGPGAPGVVTAVFLVLFGVSVVLFVVATFALAAYGIVGESGGGRFALRGYGVCWLLSQAAYLGYTYAFPASTVNFTLVLLSTGFLALMLVFGLGAAIVIAASRIAWGAARWSLFVGIGVSIGAGVVISTSDSLVVLTVMETVSAVGMVFVAVTYFFAAGRSAWVEA